MKYCPNPACPTLNDLGMVAEYEDGVTYCDDCGTLLISADSPPNVKPQPSRADADEAPAEFDEEMALLGSFESWEDAEACREELERIGIPALIEEVEAPSDFEQSFDEDEEDASAFNLTVRKQDVFQAMKVIQEMYKDEEEDWDDDTNWDDEESEWDDDEESEWDDDDDDTDWDDDDTDWDDDDD